MPQILLGEHANGQRSRPAIPASDPGGQALTGTWLGERLAGGPGSLGTGVRFLPGRPILAEVADVRSDSRAAPDGRRVSGIPRRRGHNPAGRRDRRRGQPGGRGKAAGSASPLTWAQAQELRLITSLGAGRDVETPAVTVRRYTSPGPPGTLPVTLSAPAAGTTLSTASTTVTGTTTPGARVTIESADTTTGATAAIASTVAGGDGSFSATVPVGFGNDAITATATAAGGRSTGYAQVAVIGDVTGGTTVLSVTDPAGDDSGPGTYQYPTASDFHPGAFDLTGFQVISDGTTVYLRTSLANLDPTFGAAFGAQLLDVYVHDPAASQASTQAAYASRNYTIASAGAWSELVEAQGFAAPSWTSAQGSQVGTAYLLADQATKTVTIALPEAQFGTPGPGWAFTVVLTGQDGFSSDQARAFTTAPGAYTFGVCALSRTSPICALDPSTVPKAMDVLTPAGVSQDTELDPVPGPVVIQPVIVP
ncbi:MAG TPA: glucodextranase DOMON-like domain-containing protein [Streptosporangiaceae bacterium]|jgi:glucoamylase